MTSSSPEGRGTAVIGAEAESKSATVRALAFAQRELRSGDWTRLGGGSVLGDPVTEHTLTTLAADAQAAARAQGYATGWAEGRHAAEEQAREEQLAAAERWRREEERREAEHRDAVHALLRAATALEQSAAETCARVETHAVRLAAQLTETLVGHELAVAKAPGLGAVRRALALLPGEPVARIRVAPEEASTPELAELAGSAVVVADPALSRGDALVETDSSVVDARVSTAMQRVLEVLA
jgi:flagellar assembly protein FliH